MFNSSIYSVQSKDQVDCESEVELISLISERLPHYKLREDYSVRFSGYQHSDFNRAEQIKEQISELTNDQIHQTLEYFILCGLRVNKIMDTYEDCAALTLLVQEQRSHLDLAANIGLNLVDKNTQLEQRVVCLEKQLDESNNTLKQMTHQMALKDDLLRMFNSEIEDSEEQQSFQIEPCDTEFTLSKVNVSQLETKLSRLEEENMRLRDQQHTITNRTDLLENKETQLVDDCVNHMLESTKNIERLSFELNKKTNEYLNQHEEMSRLLISKIDLENKTRHLLTENDNLITKVRDYQTKEFTLTKEVADMRDRYDECINLLNEKQDEIRLLKKKIERMSMREVQYYSHATAEPDHSRSWAVEIEDSCKRGAEEMDQSRTMRIMEQARALNTAWVDGDEETSSGFTEDLCTSYINAETAVATSPEQMSGNFLLRRSIQNDCERRRLLRHHHHKPGKGNNNQSLSSTIIPCRSPTHLPDSHHYLSEALYHRQSSCNGFSYLNTNIIDHHDSTVSTDALYRFPDKLQLVKPIEGSQTLRVWQNLATPSLTKALFEDQPQGVCFRGQQLHVTSSESSPNSETSQNQNGHGRMMASDYEDTDFEEPMGQSQVVSVKETESSSRMTNAVISPSMSVHKTEDISAFNLSKESGTIVSTRRSSHSSFSTRDNTPVNDVHLSSNTFLDPCHRRSLILDSGDNPPSLSSSTSWLDRFTVSSIMTSILGYSRPISSAIFTSTSNYKPSAEPISSALITCSSVPETSLIGRLTHLPPLAKHKPPQQRQSAGLNLLTSLAPSYDVAIHRMATTINPCEETHDEHGQVD